MLFRGEGMQNRHTLSSLGVLRNFRGSGWAAVECTAKPFLPGVVRKEGRAAARVKAEGMRYRSAARLYARRSAGKMHVAGKDGEDRLVRIDARLESGKIRTIADAPRQERPN